MKYRKPPGMRHSEALVRRLKARVAAGEDYRDVASALQMSHSTAYKIVSGQTWKHVKPYSRVLKATRKTMTPKKAEAIRKEYERSGFSYRKTSKLFRVSVSVTHDVLNKDAPGKRMKWKDADAKRAITAARKYGVERVAERLGVSQFAVRTLMERSK